MQMKVIQYILCSQWPTRLSCRLKTACDPHCVAMPTLVMSRVCKRVEHGDHVLVIHLIVALDHHLQVGIV